MTAGDSTTRTPAREVAPLGPDSLTWRYFGLWLGFAYGSVPQLLQVMHPVLGHAVDEHSNVKEDPFDRLIRSMGPIYGVIYDGPRAEETAVAVRSYHEQIKGTMPSGERYSALNPEVFHWAHATFVEGLVYGFSDILGPFSRAEQEQLYAESRRWYGLYRMTMTNVPETLDDFDAYWDHYVEHVLEATPFSRWLLEAFRKPPPPPGLTWVPKPLWRPLSRVGGQAAVVLATERLPERVRRELGLPWSRAHRVEAAVLRRTLRALNDLLPRHRRYHPRPLAGWQRAAGERGVPVADLLRQSCG
ncbi:oxygenase MpaB family protein [Nocardioides halotolerans]|uniref:oxygenase MpaB family protein n=1 Tax=Nocardioides halotolerans TaxID=433660 RepID=UPI00146F2BFA|nr:oxygenase MpaB family protein [Nocardioides halotolerans]